MNLDCVIANQPQQAGLVYVSRCPSDEKIQQQQPTEENPN